MPKWKREQLEAALKEVETSKGKESIHKMANKHGILSSTLHDHVRKMWQRVEQEGPLFKLGQSRRSLFIAVRFCRKWFLG